MKSPCVFVIPGLGKESWFMYNDPNQNNFNNTNNINNPSEPLDQDKGQEVKTTQENTNSSYTAPSYHTGEQNSQNPYPTQTSWQYGAQNQTPNTYTWNGTQPSTPYYQPPKPKKPRDPKKTKKFALRAVAAVLCCAVVSLASVGIFAAMIQTGVVNIESTGSSGTAAFTLYKQADSGEDTSNVVTTDQLTRQQAAQKVIPSVVCIQNYQISTDGFFFSGNSSEDTTGSLAGEGSGIIISEDGYIVTNQHVVSGASNLEVVTSDGVSYEATLVGEDTQTDLAVIKIDATGLTAAEFAASDDLQVGDEVMAVGNPGGLQLSSSVTFGYVSALNRPVTNGDTGYTINCIQTDAAINPGNSGGALVDMNGRVVGINSSKIAATEYEGLGFAIPSDTVQPIVSDLMEHGYVKDRPMLGITSRFLNALQAAWNNVPSGSLVDEVISEEATKSGLQRNDIITAIDDTQVTSATTIATYIADKKPGDTVTLTVYRYSTGESLKIDLVLSENTGLSNQSSNS